MERMQDPDCAGQVPAGRLAELRARLPDAPALEALAELFKIFSDPTRVKILCSLFDQEICVCEIAGVLDMSPSAISHQLRVLRGARLVRSRRDGKTIYYALADAHVREMIAMAEEHLKEQR